MLPKGKLYPHEIRVLKTLVLMGYKDIDIAHSLGVSSEYGMGIITQMLSRMTFLRRMN